MQERKAVPERINEVNKQDPYLQYLKYGSCCVFRDGSKFPRLGLYREVLKATPEPEQYRSCWIAFRKERDPIAREKLILWNMRIVYAAACYLVRWPLFTMEMEDLMSYGCQGLIEALEQYDEAMGKDFSNFAFFKIMTRMWKGMEEYGISRKLYRRQNPDDLQIVSYDGRGSVQEEIRRYEIRIWEYEHQKQLQQLDLNIEIETLGKEEKEILRLIFEEEYSQKESARILKITRYSVRKHLFEALEKLEKYLKST